jgi:diadenosine tetraphosphatase ApaH/serine/threonine PP2A family protein phosphatase
MRNLNDEHRDWIKNLPYTVEKDDILLVHASPNDPPAWHYIHNRMRVGEMVRAFSATPARLIFVGHSHQPMILVQKGEEYYRFLGDRLKLEDGCRYLVNVGSTGQPRDGNPRASYAIYDQEEGSVAIERVSYDVAQTKQKIRDAGLPSILADRLDAGS